jgi:hypothetical protein
LEDSLPPLQNWEQATVPAAKLKDYVLNEGHEANQGKARLFAALGYTADNWEQLEADLRAQHLTRDAVESRPTKGGRTYTIDAPLVGPRGSRLIRSVWQIDYGEEVPHFLTAYGR